MLKFHCPRCKSELDERQRKYFMCGICGFQLSTYKIEKRKRTKKIIKMCVPLIFAVLIFGIAGSGFLFFNSRIQVGKITENGGIIFYDKLFYSDGWRYLEVAPKNLPATYWSESVNEKALNEFSDLLGNGARNSYTVIYRYGAKSAAYKALDYGKTDDWYLGNKKEMKALLKKIKSKKIIKAIQEINNSEDNLSFEEFQNIGEEKNNTYIYWTSELASKNEAYAVNFENGEEKVIGISEKCLVRPIRKF